MAIVISIFALLISFSIALIAVQQFLLAKEKFNLDLFNKRYAVFKGVQLFVFQIVMNLTAKTEDFQKFNLDTETAVFIFDEDIPKFLDQVRSKAHDLKRLKDMMEMVDQKGEEHHKLFKQKEALQMEFYDMETSLRPKFAPYLKFSKWKFGMIWPKH